MTVLSALLSSTIQHTELSMATPRITILSIPKLGTTLRHSDTQNIDNIPTLATTTLSHCTECCCNAEYNSLLTKFSIITHIIILKSG